ncbi:MAG: carboxypeptidase-like regulatory domain-containing protein [Bacteroidia bacterium]
MKLNKFLVSILLLLNVAVFAQGKKPAAGKHSISGTVKDSKTGEDLIGVGVYVEELKTGTTTNAYGFYSLSLPSGIYTIVFSYTGYDKIKKQIDFSEDHKMNIEMTETKRELKEVVVSTDKPDNSNIQQTKMSVIRMEMKEVKKIPLLLGEVDIIKAIQMMPGIQAAGDGNTLYTVRGGNIDHNLVLLDEAVVYNPSHEIGFFSVFNGDAIKDFEIYKGGIPAEYGGRLASVLDVRMKDGNSKEYGVSGGLGFLSSRLTVEGPIEKDKSSFIISGRRSYYDLFFPVLSLALAPFGTDLNGITSYFGDLNVKTNFKLGEKDKLFISGYLGRDKIGLSSLLGFGWGNYTATARWNHVFNNKFFSNTSFIFSRYDYNFDLDIAKNLNFTRENLITDYTLKSDYSYFFSPKSKLKFGVSATHHTYEPGKIVPITSESAITPAALPEKFAMDYAVYAGHKYSFTNRLTVDYGLRFSVFQNIGTSDVNSYQNGTPNYLDNGQIKPSAIIGVEHYSPGNIYNTNFGLEPRFNATYLINEVSSVKLSYNRMFQYMHLIQTTTASTGQEFWTPTDKYIKPQMADQMALGYFRNFMDNSIEFSAEIYYKKMYNTVEIKDGADLEFNNHIETEIVEGQGRSYGLELFLRKQRGKTTGWVSYCLSKSERQADGINNNNWYSYRFDRTHYLTLVVSHELTRRIILSANFIYATGDSYTPALSTYSLLGQQNTLYGDRNSARVPDYNRLDLSVILYQKKKEAKPLWIFAKRKFEGNWVFSVYNVYGRHNTFTIAYSQDATTGQNMAYNYYLFSIVPAVTYNFKF